MNAKNDLRATERKVRGGFAFALLCLGGVGLVSYLSVVRLRADAAWVQHTFEVIGHLKGLLSAATEAQSGARGYVITGDESNLEPYHRAVQSSGIEYRRVRELTVDNLSQQERLTKLAPLVDGQFAAYAGAIELRRTKGIEAAQADLLSGKGKQFHDQILQLIDEMVGAEQTLLNERERQAHRSAVFTQAVILGGGMLACGCVALALLVIRRDFAARRRAEQELREAKEHLESRVQQRTAELARANEALRDSERRLQETGHLAKVGGWEFDPVSGRGHWTPEVALIHDLSPDVEPSKEMGLQFYHGESRARLETALQRAIEQGTPYDLELEFVSAKGVQKWVRSICHPVVENGKTAKMRGALQDITERKKAEETRARLAAIIESSDDAIIGKTLGGVITSWNHGAQELFGFSAGEAVGKPLTIIIPPERSNEEPEILKRIQAGETVQHFETVRVRKDGSRVHISATISPIRNGQGVIVGASKIARDITERKTAERKVQGQLARLELLQRITRAIAERQDLRSIFQVTIRRLEDHLPIDFGCLCLCDASRESLSVTCVGIKSEALARELAMPEHVRIDIDPNGLSRCVQGDLVYEPDIREGRFPFPQRLAKGGLRSLVLAPLLVESNVFGVLVAARREAGAFSSGDCEFLQQVSEHVALAAHQAQLHTALQEAYVDLRQTQQTVMQQERLRALGQMASGIAHDINNALSPVALYTEALLEREPNLTSGGREKLETIERAIDDVAQTVARMREFYRQREEQITLAPVDLNQLARQVIELTRARWSDLPQQRGVTIQLATELNPDLPAIMAAESEIREALTNLIFNATDAMPEGGTLTLRTRVVEEKLASMDESPRRQVQIEVSDTGQGMDEETRRRCLEPFFTTKGERGTGLGLAMVYGVVQRHSADIDIESAVGKGTTVRLVFSASPATVAAAREPVAASGPVTRLRILVVDDDPLLLNSLTDILEADGHKVAAANNGQEGIKKFLAASESNTPFAVVITDLGMPNVDGRTVASAVKARSRSTPVILLTGWGRRLVAEGDIPPHVDRVLAKPPKLRELREALASCASPPAA